jgi:transcription elongation GreA/GreB family factor
MKPEVRRIITKNGLDKLSDELHLLSPRKRKTNEQKRRNMSTKFDLFEKRKEL